MLEAISILFAVLTGFLLVQALDPVPNVQPRWAAILFHAALGTGVGMALTSVVFLLLDVSEAATPAAIFGIDAAVIAVLSWQRFLWWRRFQSREKFQSSGTNRVSAGVGSAQDDQTPSRFRWTWLLAVSFAASLLISWIRLVQMAAALPVGEWDAWALWNLRAKFLAGPGGAWRYAVSPLINNTHPDYPLLLSAFIARAWKAGGTVDTFAPMVTSLLFFAALIALLVSAVALLRGAASALLAGLVLLSATSLLDWAPAQYADIPLAFYFLAAIALIFLEASPAATSRWASRWTLLWAGLCAGFAAWTKNEGIAILACSLIVFSAFTLWRSRTRADLIRSGWMLAGAAPGLFLTLWLKFSLAPAVDPLVTQGASSGLARLSDFSRYAQVAGEFFKDLLNLGSGVSHPLILLAILAVLLRWHSEERYRLPSRIAGTVLALVFLSYCAVFLVTPYVLGWQLQSSFDRLILQIWPSALLVFFVQLRSVADTAPLAAPAKSAATRKAAGRPTRAASSGVRAR
jgi:hypothetical protein